MRKMIEKHTIGLAFLVLLFAGAALIIPAQAVAEIRDLDITPDPASPGQNVTVSFQGRVTTAWWVFYYAIAFSNDSSIEYTDDWVVEEGGIYDSSMPSISHDVNPGRQGIQQTLNTSIWYDYNLTITIPEDYDGTYNVNVIAAENWVACQRHYNYWQKESSAAFTVSGAEPIVTSCDIDGNEINQFAPGENVYVKAEGLATSTSYKVWIQNNPVSEGDTLIAGENPVTAETPKSVTTDASGKLVGQPVLIWSIPVEAAVTHHEYDIVVDKQDDGDNTGKYNFASDGLDFASIAGIVAPVPDVSSLILFASGLVLTCIYFVCGRRRREG